MFWKVVKKAKFVNLAEVDLFTGKAEVDAECKERYEEPEKERAQMSRMERVWDSCW
jgi:amino acid transporter